MVVLVGYASAHGSTRQVAEQIASRLRDRGHLVDLRPMDEVGNPGAYDAAVLGSAIHGGSWLEGATAFIDRGLGALTGRPVWLFSVGMAAALPRPMQAVARR